MGFDTPSGVAIREKAVPSARATVCPKCHAVNPPAILRCKSCLTPLPSKAAAPKTVAPRARPDVDAILGELEALTHLEESPPTVHYQCPACKRTVDASATRCRCGVLFEDPRPIVGYECPLCGARVDAAATRCRCGARFSG